MSYFLAFGICSRWEKSLFLQHGTRKKNGIVSFIKWRVWNKRRNRWLELEQKISRLQTFSFWNVSSQFCFFPATIILFNTPCVLYFLFKERGRERTKILVTTPGGSVYIMIMANSNMFTKPVDEKLHERSEYNNDNNNSNN